MLHANSRAPAALGLVGSVLGLIFAGYSSVDYASHLDRQLHDMHCSFIPGAAATAEAEACRAAMYSPYSALLREQLWGGLPISLFALGAFCFFAAFSLYLLLARGQAPKTAVGFFAAVSVTPLLVSLGMFVISVTQVGALCKTCVGLYVASLLVAAGGLLGLFTLKPGPSTDPTPSRGRGNAAWVLAWLSGLAITTLFPAAVYAGSVPDHDRFLTGCGELKQAPDEQDGLVSIRTAASSTPALLFEDPLCPTCKAFHERLVGEDVFGKLDIQLSLFPLDNSCNWMLDAPLHPGACTVSKAVLCGGGRALEVLEWAYEEQQYLTRAGKAGEPILRAVIKERWGPDMIRCIDDRQTAANLNRHLHFAADNGIPVSTPQMYLGARRICDEDTDIGLRYTLSKLAPEVVK
ncbi:MAG TPA: vitamin K epoxide reductase family protein [Polyangiaceae bacterium]|nr:vitamin K epoxide reductase family protein [Polyangiaceae bacterium]